MSSRPRILGAGVILVGLVIAFQQARTVALRQREIDDLKTETTDVRRSVLKLRLERDDLRRELARVQALPAEAPAPALSANPEPAPAPLPPQPTPPPSRSGIVSSRDGKLIDSFAANFGLSANEKSGLQAAIDEARVQLARLKVAHAQWAEGAEDKLGTATITIGPFPEGEVVRDTLQRAFAVTLGAERFAIMQAHYGVDAMQDDLGGFGTETRTITIMRYPANFTVMDMSRQAAPDGRSRSTAVQTMVRDIDQPGGRDYRELFVPFADRLKAMPLIAPPQFIK
jgi:FtsZ-binding cell division protein ZapB